MGRALATGSDEEAADGTNAPKGCAARRLVFMSRITEWEAAAQKVPVQPLPWRAFINCYLKRSAEEVPGGSVG